MNEKFFDLKREKQDRMINAGLKVFAKNGYRHHVAVTKGNYAAAIKEAFENYLEYKIDLL